MSDHEDIDARPQKRPRLDDSSLPSAPATSAANPSTSHFTPVSAPTAPNTPASSGDSDLDREFRAGITEYVCPDNLGFTGILKQRYTDFQVNEILPTGEVLHLKIIGVVKQEDEVQGNGGDEQKKAQVDGDAEMMDVDKVKEGGQVERKEAVQEQEIKTEERDDANGGDDLSKEDAQALVAIFGEDTAQSVRRLVRQIKSHTGRKAKDFKAINGPVISDKDQRTKAHQLLRRIFPNMLESLMEPDQSIRIKARPPAERGNKRNRNNRDQDSDRRRGRLAWEEKGGEYLHFTLYKENKDTMEVVGFLGSRTGGGPKSYGFAGTKDRRACTVQRVCVQKQTAERMTHVGRQLFNSAIGDFEYKHHDIRLGDLAGNEFYITLRDCHFEKEDGLEFTQRLELAEKVLSQAVMDLGENGFINYYGLQRFGSFAASTDAIGIKLLQENLQGAVEDILGYSDVALRAANDDTEEKSTVLISQDDRLRAKGLHIWESTQSAGDALRILPKKFSAERNVIQHLGSRNQKTGRYDRAQDWQGALMTIPRGLRLMYVHAYQSLVWNVVAGKRWTMLGNKVVEGDLVLVHEHKDKEGGYTEEAKDTVDQDGEVVINPAGEDSAFKNDDAFERARPLTKKEVESGRYTVFDIVLPQPGFDVEYPGNAIGEFYKEFMGSERGGGLDPHNMRRKWREISLSGGYRKFLSKPLQTMSFEIKEYTMREQQLVETDLDRVKKQMEEGEAEETEMRNVEQQKIAVLLKFQLGTSQYATIALRELMKAGGVKTFKPEFMGGR
ncbi:tRNA pseudouridine synthase D [Lophiostoma macrostomum CBS 122681]|uniref:tRNA pseudouridine synthase D n=1 Tax=Lophiostoma macrostomum CBS 122681 TaxID=1314788 RepID=A0A6A6SZQ2_9PLEO|nr:tRNA pseudouridine synthase D [Lophiostoma macrostomum CBS 122681]